MDALFGEEDRENIQNDHHDADDQNGAGVAGLGVLCVDTGGESGQQRDEEGVDEDITQCLEDLLDVAQLTALVTVSGDEGDEGVVGNLHEGEAHGVDDVVHQKHVDVFYRCGEGRRYPEQQQCGDGEGNAHTHEPRSGLAHGRFRFVDNVADNQVTDAVEHL